MVIVVATRISALRPQEMSKSRGTLLLSLFVGGVLNAGTTIQAERQFSEIESTQILALSNSLTILYILVLFVQLLFLASRTNLSQIGWITILVLCISNSVGLGTLSVVLINAPFSVEVQLGLLLVCLAIATHLHAIVCSGLMQDGKWLTAALLSIVAPVARSLFGNIAAVESSVTSFLLFAVAAQTVACLIALFFAKAAIHVSTRQLHLSSQSTRQLVAMYGFAAIIGVSSWTRFLSDANSRRTYEIGYFDGRVVLVVAIMISTVYLPDIVSASRLNHLSSVEVRKGTLFVSVATIATIFFVSASTPGTFSVGPLRNDSAGLVIGIAWTILSVSLIPFLYLVVLQSRLVLVVVPLVILLVSTRLTSDSPLGFAQGLLVTTGALSISVLLPFLARSKSRTYAKIITTSPVEALASEKLTVVVPSYNPGPAVADTVSAIYQSCAAARIDVSVIAVSDGSCDESIAILESMAIPQFRHVRFYQNRGKGAALREGFRFARTEYVAFIDADGDIPADQLPGMVAVAKQFEADVVFASKWHPLSEVDVGHLRRLLSRLHQIIQILLFDISISDSQVGIKVYRTDLIRRLEPVLNENGFSLDIELFVAAAANGRNNFIEMPVKLSRKTVTTIGTFTAVQVLMDLLRIFWRLRINLNYSLERRGMGQGDAVED